MTSGPDIPEAIGQHCMVQINGTHTFLGAGNTYTGATHVSLAKAWLYDWARAQWTRLPDMAVNQHGSHCKMLGSRKLMVLGGQQWMGPFKKVKYACC